MNKILLLISFVLTYTYIILNLYNVDKSIVLDSDSLWKMISINEESVNFYGLFDSFSSVLFKIILPVLLFLGGSILVFRGDYSFEITAIMLIISIIFYVYSTYLFNIQDKTNVCTLTQLTLQRDRDKNTFNSQFGYKIIYSVGLLGLIYSSFIKRSSTVSVGILLYFIIGILFQVFGSYLLKLFTNTTSWPSIFSYLDQFIQNTNTENKEDDSWMNSTTIYKIIGSLRLILLVVLSGIGGYYLIGKNKDIHLDTIKVDEIVKVTGTSWILFIVLIIVWQTLIGDGCIINRTIDKHKIEHKDNNSSEDNPDNDLSTIIYNSTRCSVDNQLGIYFYLIIFSLIFFYVGLK